MPEAFYERDGELYVPTELTRGPWDPDSQHAGPPAAILGREIAALGDGEGRRQVGRITFEILRSLPIEPLRVEVRVVRPGRSVELVDATLSSESEAVMRATAWRLRSADVELPEEVTGAGGPGLIGTSPSTLRPGFAPPPPAAGEPKPFFETGQKVGYHTAMEYRFVSGSFREPGPATTWLRMRVPLVAREEPTPLERVLVAADTGNGISAALDYHRYLFINVDLSVHLHRLPAGEWVCLDAITIAEPQGVGISDAGLYDERGPLGRAVQTLLIGERTE